jgi:hypothetical protein
MPNNFSEIITRKFPHDPDKGFYAQPNLPAVKTGKALMKYTRIATANEVLGLHEYGGLFGGGTIVLTATHCHHPDGSFALEDLHSAHADAGKIRLAINQAGAPVEEIVKTDGPQAAKLLVGVFDAIIYAPKADDLLEEERSFEGLNRAEIDWVKLRDEVMRTIDMLHQRFQDGKISLTEYEEKKDDLLIRL